MKFSTLSKVVSILSAIVILVTYSYKYHAFVSLVQYISISLIYACYQHSKGNKSVIDFIDNALNGALFIGLHVISFTLAFIEVYILKRY